MRAVVVYESMYGNTHTIAERIAAGLRTDLEVEVVPVDGATPEVLAGADLLVVGGPTHIHGMSSHRSRHDAVERASDPSSDLELDPDAEGEGLRDWFHHLPDLTGTRAAAFDTRVNASPAMTGRASKGIARRLRHHGLQLVRDPESFLVDGDNHLLPGEEDRARDWGAELAQIV